MPRFAANLTMLFNEVEFLERFGAARQLGFRGVEYLFPYPYKKEELAERLEEFSLTQVLHNLPAGAMPARQLSWRQRRARAYSIAVATPSRNSALRSGRQAMPRSPFAQSPAGRLCSTCVRPNSSRRCASSSFLYG